MNDISKFVYKETEDSDLFYADFEDYTTGIVNTQGYESGDLVKWVWEERKYIGTLRQTNTESLFEITNVRVRE